MPVPDVFGTVIDIIINGLVVVLSNQPSRLVVQIRMDAHPHLLGGCGFYYNQDMQQFTMFIVQAGYADHPIISQARVGYNFLSHGTTDQYEVLLQRLGHYRPCCCTGNTRATVLWFHNLVMLALHCVTFSKVSAAEINAFLFRVNYGDPFFHFYTNSQIAYAEQRIGLVRKRGSTTALQAYLPINICTCWIYWNLLYPYGIADIRQADLIDLDECGIFVETVDRKIGKAHEGNWVR